MESSKSMATSQDPNIGFSLM